MSLYFRLNTISKAFSCFVVVFLLVFTMGSSWADSDRGRGKVKRQQTQIGGTIFDIGNGEVVIGDHLFKVADEVDLSDFKVGDRVNIEVLINNMHPVIVSMTSFNKSKANSP